MDAYGYDIKQTLITDIIPNANVKKVPASLFVERLRLVSFFIAVVLFACLFFFLPCFERARFSCGISHPPC